MAYERDYRGERYRDDRGGDPRDRGFFERAGDEVRSWFGDDDAERRRRYDERLDDRIDRERYASTERGGYRSPTNSPGWARSNRDDAPRGGGSAGYGYGDYREYEGRQFDDGNRGYGAGFSGSRDRGYSPQAARGQADRYGDDWQRGYNRDAGQGRDHGRDEHGYSSWRDRQMSAFDRDYDEYRRENQSRFETEFASWRQNRQTQRDSLGQVKEHQEVVGSDGAHVGTVDHVRSDHILLTKTDKDAGGHHHSIPSSWIVSVAEKVQLSKTADEAKRAWRDTEERGGLFGGKPDDREDRGTRGQLGRSFSGTY